MLNYEKDIENTISFLNNERIPGYSDLYFSSNENLKDIFGNIDFTDKKVLSVLSSGDQAFHIYDHNSSHIDLFDINVLTIYFFYLRIWHIEQYNKFHLPLYVNNEYMQDLLKRINPKTEEENQVYNYWQELVKIFIDYNISLDNIRMEYPKKLIEVKRLESLKEKIKGRDFNFYNIDISKPNNTIKEKYDIIYLSNIIDWLLCDNSGLKRLVTNLDNLLVDSGTVIVADLMGLGPGKIEEEIFREHFKKTDLPITSNSDNSDEDNPGYCYQKRKK